MFTIVEKISEDKLNSFPVLPISFNFSTKQLCFVMYKDQLLVSILSKNKLSLLNPKIFTKVFQPEFTIEDDKLIMKHAVFDDPLTFHKKDNSYFASMKHKDKDIKLIGMHMKRKGMKFVVECTGTITDSGTLVKKTLETSLSFIMSMREMSAQC